MNTTTDTKTIEKDIKFNPNPIVPWLKYLIFRNQALVPLLKENPEQFFKELLFKAGKDIQDNLRQAMAEIFEEIKIQNK